MSVIEHYNKTARTYCERTVSFDLQDQYIRFFKNLPTGASILDAGCGPGRDTKAFLEHGFDAHAIDGSIEMVNFASQYLQRPVTCIRYEEMDFTACFDAIWANASLTHTSTVELSHIFPRFIKALKPMGYWYMSFKHGLGIQMNRNIPCYLQTEGTLKNFIGQFPELKMEEIQTYKGKIANGQVIEWISCIVQKKNPL